MEVDAAEERRTRDIQIFSSPSNAPRTRWRSDLLSAGVTGSLLLFLAIVAGNGSSFDDNTLQFIGTLPGWLLWLGQAAYFVGVVYGLAMVVGVGLVAHRRLELLRDILLAAAIAIGLIVLFSQIFDNRWPDIAFLDLNETRTTFPMFTIGSIVAVQAAASPHLTTTIRHFGWTIIIAATFASVLGGVTTVSDALGAVLVGLLAAALVRYAFGTTAGIPSINRVRRGLADLGVDVDDLAYDAEPDGVVLALTGTTSSGERRAVSVLGSDAWNSRRISRWWRAAWYHDVGSQHGSDRRQQIEHEALAMTLAERHGASVADVVTVGMTVDDDAILVTSDADHRLIDVDPATLDADVLAAVWDCVLDLHRAGLSHGAIDARSVWFGADGRIQLAGFSDAALHPSREQQQMDLAAVLVMLATHVGEEDAIASGRGALGDEDLASVLPLVQAASLSQRLRTAARHRDLKPDHLRKETAAALGIDAPEPVQLTRVTWMSVVMVPLLGFAAYTIIAGLADVGLDTIVETLSDARWGLVLIGLVLAGATNYTDAYALVKVSPKPVPLGITTIEQFAIGFVNMAVPSAAGRIATNARFFQKFGINPVTSTACGAITGFLGFIAQTILIIITLVVGAGSIDLSELQGGGGVMHLLVMAAIIIAAAIVVVAAVPKLRHRALDMLRTLWSQLGEAFSTVKNPRVAIRALGGALATEILYGAGLVMCVLAMGGSISLGEAVFINVTVSLFAGLMPIPGGVGVTEAGMTAGLTAIGISSDVAVGAVLVYRLISYYLPPTWGYVSLRWLSRHDYL